MLYLILRLAELRGPMLIRWKCIHTFPSKISLTGIKLMVDFIRHVNSICPVLILTLGIHVTAYSPLGNSNPTYKPGEDDFVPLLKNKVINKIAEERGCTVAQVALKWGLLRRTSVIPKSGHIERIEEDFEATKCDFKPEDIFTLSKELPVKRFNNPSDSWKVPLFDGLEGTSVVGKITQKVQKVVDMAAERLDL